MEHFTERQIEIIQSAGKIITEGGVSSLTTKNLSREMKFTESALYRHFSGKEAIIKALLQYLTDDMESRLSAFQGDASAPLEKLKFIFLSQLHFFAQKPFFVGVIFPESLFKEDEEIKQGVKKIMATRMSHLLPTITACQQLDLLRKDLSAEETAHIMMGSFRLLTQQWQFSDFSFDIIERGQALLMNLIKITTPCKN